MTKTQNEGGKAMGRKLPKYDEAFKRSIATLCQNGKSQTEVSKEYGISSSAISRWVRQHTEVQIDDETVITAQQVKELQKRNALLEEENIILKKAIAWMNRTIHPITPHLERG